MILGAVLAVSDTVVAAFRYRPQIVASRALRSVELPPCFYIRLDDRVYAVHLKD
jgi:hypothetical protein